MSNSLMAWDQMDAESRLTIGILVGREAEWLDQCLSQVSPFNLPLLVVGSHAMPAISDLCKKWGAVYEQRLPSGAFSFAAQRQHLLALCPTPWLLMLDVDEHIDQRSLAESLRISGQAANRVYMVRHSYWGQAGLLFVDHQPRLMPSQAHLHFEGHVANTLQAEHSRQEQLYPANIEITDHGAAMDGNRIQMRGERHRKLAGLELKRLAELARKGDTGALPQLGFRYYMMGRHRAAAHFFKRLLAINSAHPEGQYYLARIEAQTHATGQKMALKRLWHLAASGRKHYRIFQYLSRIHGRRGEHADALRAAEQGAAHHHESAIMQHYLAAARYYAQDSGGALKALNHALELWPDFEPAQALNNRLIRAERTSANHLDPNVVMQ